MNNLNKLIKLIKTKYRYLEIPKNKRVPSKKIESQTNDGSPKSKAIIKSPVIPPINLISIGSPNIKQLRLEEIKKLEEIKEKQMEIEYKAKQEA